MRTPFPRNILGWILQKKLWLLLTIVWAATLVFTLGGGLVLGVYYHRELGVLWQAYISDRPDWTSRNGAGPEVIKPAIDRATTSVIELTGLSEPLPLIYSDTLDEATLQEYLQEGAVVLPLGTSFGEPGNVVVTAHSSGTQAFGPYRFAFAKLSELAVGGEFSISTPLARYTYRVYAKEIVWPHEVDKLPADNRSTVTLVTCWPLWTNFQRLLVHTELVGVDYQV